MLANFGAMEVQSSFLGQGSSLLIGFVPICFVCEAAKHRVFFQNEFQEFRLWVHVMMPYREDTLDSL